MKKGDVLGKTLEKKKKREPHSTKIRGAPEDRNEHTHVYRGVKE